MTKRPEEIALLAESGRLLAEVFNHLDRLDLIGISTMQDNDLVEDVIVHKLHLRRPSNGHSRYAFPLNASPNQEVCTGVPSAQDVLQYRDIANFHITLEKDGYLAHASKTYLAGEVAPPARGIVEATYEAICEGI